MALPAGFTGETRRNGEVWRLGRSPLPRRRRRVRHRNAVGAVSRLSDEGCSSRIPPSLLGLGVCSPLSRTRGTRGTYYRPDIGFPRRSSRHSDRPTSSLRDCRRCMLRGRCPSPPVGASVLFDRSGLMHLTQCLRVVASGHGRTTPLGPEPLVGRSGLDDGIDYWA